MGARRVKKISTSLFIVSLIFGIVMPNSLTLASEGSLDATSTEQSVQRQAMEDLTVFSEKITRNINKIWVVSLNDTVHSNSVHASTVYVKDSSGKIFPTWVQAERDIIEIQPLVNYVDGEKYNLFITSDVTSTAGVKMKESIQMPFLVEVGEVIEEEPEIPEVDPEEPEDKEVDDEKVEEGKTEDSEDALEEVEVIDFGDGTSYNTSTPLKTTVDQVTNKPEALVVYSNEEGRQAIESYQSSSHDELLESLNIMKISVDNDEFREIKENQDILFVERNVIVENDSVNEKESEIISLGEVFKTTSGDYAHWGYEHLGLEGALQQDITGKGIKVAVVDTGVSSHEDLNIVNGASQVAYTDSYEDDHGHGTHVAGIISSKMDGQGMVGVAPDADIYSVKVMNEEGKGAIGQIALGLLWAIGQKVDVINISLGGDYYSPIYESVLERVTNAGIVVVASSGNKGTENLNEETMGYPAKYDSTIAVGSIGENLNRSVTSSTGEMLDFVTPGDRIVSASHEGGYIRKSGTSMAAPQVTGMIALLKQAYPNKTVEEYKEMLKNEAIDLGPEGYDTGYGHGLVNFENLFPLEEEPKEEDNEQDNENDNEQGNKEEDEDNEQDNEENLVINQNLLNSALFYVESAELDGGKRHSIVHALAKTKRLPDSPEKKQLVERLQALGYMFPEEPNPTLKVVAVNPRAYYHAEVQVERLEKRGKGYKNPPVIDVAIESILYLPPSYERDQLIMRMQELGLMLNTTLSGLPQSEEEYDGEDPYIELEYDFTKSFEYRMANRYITNLYNYGAGGMWAEAAIEQLQMVEPSKDRDILLKRLYAQGFALDIPLFEEDDSLPDYKSYEYKKAEQKVTYLEKYGPLLYSVTPVEYTLALEPSIDRDGLLKRLQAQGFALDVPLFQKE